jgi:hypothetical protein
MKKVLCAWCKEKYNKDDMYKEEFINTNKEGKEKKTNKYYHYQCYNLYLKDKEFKRIEFEKWDKLFQYLIKLHNVEVLDGRMIKKLQNLRNGTVELNGIKNKKYKQGVKYDIILQSYMTAINNIQWVLKNKTFDTKYKEFAYFFSIMENQINDVSNEIKLIKKQEEDMIKTKESLLKRVDETDMQNINAPRNKKDVLDISDFL